MTTPAREAFWRTVEDVDPRAARAVVLQLLADGVPLDRVLREVLAPVQVRVGLQWESSEWSVADEHAATAVTETALDALARATAVVPPAGARHVVLACAQGEWHVLPARMLAAVAGSLGVRLTLLGPSVTSDELGRRLAVGDVGLLALSCTLTTNLIGAARCTAAAHAHGVPVLAGGSAFGRTALRAGAIGADAWSDDPDVLLGPPPALAGRSSDVAAEVLLLDAVDDTVLGLARERLLAAFPLLRTGPSPGIDGLRWLARSAAAALLTGDELVLDEALPQLGGGVGPLPAPVVATAAHVVADAVEPCSPDGAQLLHDAAERFAGAATGGDLVPEPRRAAPSDDRTDATG